MAGEKNTRIVLYITGQAKSALVSEADRRARIVGVELSPEAAARGILYTALGLGPKGAQGGGPDGGPTAAQVMTMVRGEMTELSRSARAGEADVEYMTRELERWVAMLDQAGVR